MKKFPFIFCLLFSIAGHSQPANNLNVLDWKADVTLNSFLLQQVHKQYDQRRFNFERATKSKQATVQYIQDLKKRLPRLMSDFPAEEPLNPQITGTIGGDGYRIEKIIYESFGSHHVTATLYIPAGKGPFPAALLFCGHEDLAKASDSYQRTAVLFAKNGFVVFVIDPVSQSERHQLTDEDGKPLTRGGTTEHTLINEAANLFGNSTPAYEFWDNKRGLDYLVTRSEVDTARIGCLGNSGGGMQTIYFAAFEPRVKVIAPCSYLTTRERTFDAIGPNDGCAQIPDEGYQLFELNDYLITAAPKPLLILAGRYDFIDYTGTEIAVEELRKIYSSLGQPNKLELFTVDDGHGISKPKRERALWWFRRWFYNDTTRVHEPDIKTLTDKELFATKTGQVNSSFPVELSTPEYHSILFDRFRSRRESFTKRSKTEKDIIVRTLLGITTITKTVTAEDRGTVTKDGITFERFIIRQKDEPPMPVLWVIPDKTISKFVIWFPEEGKNVIADSIALIRSYIDQNISVFICDSRGTGETTDKPEMNDPKYYNKEYRNAMTALHIGQNIVGQRTLDMLGMVNFIRSKKKSAGIPIEIHASGLNTLPAMHAAFLDANINSVVLYRSLQSFTEILNKPTQRDWYSYIIPSVLEFYDIPDLLKIIGEQRITFIK